MDCMSWLKSGMMKLTDQADANIVLRTKNHMALDLIRKGEGAKADIETLIGAFNMAEALTMLDVGAEFKPEIIEGQYALKTLAARSRWVFTARELTAVNLAMEIHDAQLDVATIRDIEKALDIEAHAIRTKQAENILQVSL